VRGAIQHVEQALALLQASHDRLLGALHLLAPVEQGEQLGLGDDDDPVAVADDRGRPCRSGP
jgi:hypothetical protein